MTPSLRMFCFSDITPESTEALFKKHGDDFTAFNELALKSKFLTGENVTIADIYFWE